MAVKQRKRVVRLTKAKQLELIKSPVVMDIVQFLRHCGPSTVAEIGVGIGKKPNSLHYHVRNLAAEGLVRTTSTRRSGARTVAVIDVTADRFEGANAPAQRELQDVTCDAADAVLRLAGRDFHRATAQPADLRDHGAARNITVERTSARLTKTQLAEVNRHLAAIGRVFEQNVGSQKGQLMAITVALTPIHDEFG